MSLPEETSPASSEASPAVSPQPSTQPQETSAPETQPSSAAAPPEDETTDKFKANSPQTEEGEPEDIQAFRRRLQEFEFTPSAIRPPEERPARPESPRRRRRVNRLLRRPEASELGERLESIAQRTAPTIDFFIFAFLSGGILAVGYLLNAPAILVLGIIAAPLMSPWVGAMLAAATGETRFLGQTLGALFTAFVIIFLIGALGGFVSRLFQPMDTTQALLHARLWWHDLFLLLLGAIALVVSFIQSEEKPILASFMLAYEFFLPVSAAGFGLGGGLEAIWPQAVLVFLVHLAIALILGLLIFFYMGFRPVETSGYLVTGAVVITSLAFVAGFFGLGALLNARQAALPEPSPTPSLTPTLTLLPSPTLPPTQLATITPLPPTEPPTVTPAPTFTLDASLLPSPVPTPIYGRVQSEAGGNGVIIREEPAGRAITTVLNGYLVEFLPVEPVVIKGETWVKVLVRIPTRDIEGWMLLRLIVTATPSGSP